ncbi:serine/threonine-protein kinase [Streptomyces sp. NPDC059989]|uniref:serine/threonine-protein kinase n=1 Tax=Streptomyces sp. NPDC059989 TaxID=3347026 RepID=UPI0036B4DEF5
MSSISSGGRVHPARPGDPKKIGPYRVIGRLGSGGMGTVHAALDPQGVRVAVKVIHAAQAQDAEFRARFRREVQLSARVSGPCLIPLLAADPEAEAPWLATEYAPGPTLNQHLTAYGPPTGGSLYALATGTAQALAAIHQAGVVHRDVKPQNVILSPAGPRVLDFGIAHAADGTSVTRTGVMTGTPGWISPEQYRTGTAGPAGDVFAWGALIAYAATGRLPFGTGAPDVVAFRVMSGEADLDGIPDELRRIVEQALTKEPEDRPTAEEAAEQCALLLSAQATQAIAQGGAPTMVGDLIAAEWDMPSLDDPTWHAPPRSLKRVVVGVAVAAAVAGGLTGGIAALDTGEDGRSRRGNAQGNSATPSNTTNTTNTTTQPDPLMSAADKSRQDTAKTDSGEASLATWKESRRAKGEQENEVERGLQHDLGYGQGGPDGVLPTSAAQPVVTFHEKRREVYVEVTVRNKAEIMNSYQVSELAKMTCISMRQFKGGWEGARAMYTNLGYDKIILIDTTDPAKPSILWDDNFVTNSNCATTHNDRPANAGAGDGQATGWKPDLAGFSAAQIPSTDRDEVRVATDVLKAVTAEWNTLNTGAEKQLGNDNTSVGLDPHNRVMYVWAEKPQWDDNTQTNWGRMAAQKTCVQVTAEAKTWANWPYTRYAILIDNGNTVPTWLRWGSIGDCTKA